jgi:hypothetical protein
MRSKNEPVSRQQIEAILGQLKGVGGAQNLKGESDWPEHLSRLKELIERLTRAADPASRETISQGEFMQAMDRIRTELRARPENR